MVDLFPTFCELSGTTIPDSIAIDGRSIAAQIHGKPGIPRAWVHHALGESKGGASVFDGEWPILDRNRERWDARQLPEESVADRSDWEASKAADNLERILETITPKSARPPLPFPHP